MKKAQVKFGESIGVIFITFIIIFFGIIWYSNHNQDELREMLLEEQQTKAFEHYSYLNKLSLLKYSQNGDISSKFDKVALIAFANFTKTPTGKSYIQRELHQAIITIKLFNSSSDFDSSKIDFNMTLYNNTPDLSSNYRFNYQELRFKALQPVINENKETQIGLFEFIIYLES